MMTLPPHKYTPPHQDEAHYGDFLYDLWRGKFFVLVGIIAGFLAAFFFMSAAQPHYKSEMTVAPPDTQLAMPLGLEAGREVRADDMNNAMTTITEERAPDFTRYLEMLRSIAVSEMVLKEADDVLYDELMRAGRLDFYKPFHSKNDITPARFRDYLMQKISVEPVGQTPMRRISFQHPSAEFAQNLLSSLDKYAQQIIRADLLLSAQVRIKNLRDEIEQTQNLQNKRALVTLLQAQEQEWALLNARSPQSAIFIEAPFVSSEPVWPRAAFVYPISIFIFVFLFFGLYLSIRAFRQTRSQHLTMKKENAGADT